MIKNVRLIKPTATSLCALLILLSPGLGTYQALAADFAAATPAIGLPATGAWVRRLERLAQPATLAQFSGATLAGVDAAKLLRDISTIDLRSAAGQAAASPLFERLAAAQAAQAEPISDNQIVEILATAAAERREAAGEAKAFATVRKTIAEWTDKGTDGGERVSVVGMGTARISRLSRAEARETSQRLIPASLAKKEVVNSRRAQALVVVPLLVALIAAVAVPAVSPALALTAGVVGSILLHETAHLYMLRRLGDDTAVRYGLDTLNPFKLIHPVGTVTMPILSTLASQALLGVPIMVGWAKPIPVDFNKLADPQRDAMKVALAGPAMNAALAAAAFAALAVLSPWHLLSSASASLIATFAKVNTCLAVFNMLPLPQLDGGKVLVGLLPQRLYEKWTRNSRLPDDYQDTFRKLYEGPSTLLNWLGMDSQGRVNAATRLITLGVFGAFAAASWTWLGAPVLLLMLVCSYDYYCIREKIQNEEATRALMGLLQGFASALAQEAENDDSVQSVVNTEEVEHMLKNALEDTIDEVVDSEGFDELSPEQKLQRFDAAYMDAAVEALHKKGMSADDPTTIRRLLAKLGLSALARGWIEKYDVWAKWHSPLRKKQKSLKDAVKEKSRSLGAGGATAMVAFGLVGAGLLAACGALPAAGAFATAGLSLIAGTLQQAAPRKVLTFLESLDDANLKLSDKQKAFLQRMLKEMKLETKPPITGRVDELGQLLSAITSPRGVINSMVFVGKAGVGKTAVVELLAQLLAQSDAQPHGTFTLKKMNGRTLVKLNLARLLQKDDPAAALDELLELLARFNSDDKRTGNKVILFVDEIHQLFEHPKGSQMANLLKEPLRDGELTLVAATTDIEYKKYMENDEAFRRRMIPVWLDESTVPETIRALEGAKGFYEALFGVTYTPEALKAAAELSKYDQEVFLPGRAFKYFTAAAALADFDGQRDRLTMRISDKIQDLRYAMTRLSEELSKKSLVTESLKKDEPTTIELYNLAVTLTQDLVALYRDRDAIPTEGTPTVTDALVKEEIARKTGVASGQLTLGQVPIERYLEMEKILGEEVIGQDEPIAAIARSVRQNKAGLSDPKRPRGVYYFTGPTGVGKTHLVKRLANFEFGDADAVIRVDMTEYMESHSMAKLIGAPPGYVGHDAGGQLTEKVRRKPYSVVVHDEIEKAHPAVLLVLLQILGEGRLTDGQGRTTDFTNTIIIMTSNLGMHAVDVEPYVKKFKLLQEQKRAAETAGDVETVAMLDAQMKTLADELSQETKKKTIEVTDQAFKETYPPEFQGRLHAPPIVFNRITPENALKIAELNLKELRHVLAFAGHEIEWTPAVVAHIVNEGFSVALGARPLQNAIDRLITQPIATEILKTALANGQRLLPSHIQVVMEGGQVKMTVEPVSPKAVVKKEPGEGAAQEVFANVLTATLQAAAGQAAGPVPLETLDAWVREVLAAQPKPKAAEAAKTPMSEPSPVAVNQSAPETRSSPSGILHTATPLVLSNAQSFAASHYDPDRKDPQVKAAAAALKAALEAQGYSESEHEIALRTIEDPANPFIGWLKVFVEQAKKMTPPESRQAPVTIAFEAGETAKIVVTRPGRIGEKEQTLLRAHFTGPVPADGAKARDKAEALNVMGKDGQRLMFDLYRQLAALPAARLGWAQTDSGVDYWIEFVKPAPPQFPEPATTQADAAPPLGEPSVPLTLPAPVPTTTPAATPDQLHSLAKKLALGIIAQGDQRSPSVRIAAADLLGALAGPSDLLTARDWIRHERMTDYYPKVAAAAMMLARQGNRGDDETRLIKALGFLHFGGFESDLYKPAKRRVIESLAKILATDNPRRIEAMMADYLAEKNKNPINRTSEDRFSLHRNYLLIRALYIALCKYAGPEARDLLATDQNEHNIQHYYAYLKREEPETLRRLYTTWRDNPDARLQAGPTNILTVLAIADFGARDDARRLYNVVADHNETGSKFHSMAAESIATLIGRVQAYDLVREDARRAVRETFGDSGNFSRVIVAIETIGEAGDESDLARLERVMRSNPETVSYSHEMSQHSAAMAWAKLAHRLGLIDRFLTTTAEPAAQDALPALQTMLMDTNPIINEAALEALRLRFTQRIIHQPLSPSAMTAPEQASQISPESRPTPREAFFRQATLPRPAGTFTTYRSLEDTELEAGRNELHVLSSGQRSLALEWGRRFSLIFQTLLGTPFSFEESVSRGIDGQPVSVAFVLRQAAEHVITSVALSEVTGLVNTLLDLRSLPEESRQTTLARMEQDNSGIAGVYALLDALARKTGVSMGLYDPLMSTDTSQAGTEFWLNFDLSAPTPPASSEAQSFFHEGAPNLPENQSFRTYSQLNDTELESGRTELHRMTSQQRTDARQWASGLTRLIDYWLDQERRTARFDEVARAVTHVDGRVSIVWVLRLRESSADTPFGVSSRPDPEPIPGSTVSRLYSKIQQLLDLPQHSDVAPGGMQEPSQRTYELLRRLSADPNVKMGLLYAPSLRQTPDRGELELWLKFELPAPAETPELHPVM